MDTGQADMGNQQGDRAIGESTGEAWQRGQAVVKGKWGRLGHRGNWLGTNGGKGGGKERPHKTRDFEICASMPKTSLLVMLTSKYGHFPGPQNFSSQTTFGHFCSSLVCSTKLQGLDKTRPWSWRTYHHGAGWSKSINKTQAVQKQTWKLSICASTLMR